MAENKKILIIEDDTSLSEMLRMHISGKRERYNVVLAGDGEEGLRMVGSEKPDLVILDINLPKIGGIEVFKRMCGKDGKPPAKVLILTGRTELESFFDSINVDSFVTKPFSFDYLLGEIDRVLSNKKKPVVFIADSETKQHMVQLVAVLKKAGFKSVFIHSAKALKDSITATNRPDILVAEFEQGSGTCESILNEMKKLSTGGLPETVWPKDHKVAVIVYTYSDKNYREKSNEAGADKYIGKPKSVEDILKTVNQFYLEARKKKDEAAMRALNPGAGGNKPKLSDLGSIKF